MGVVDRTKHFDGLDAAAPPVQVPNDVSRYLKPGERSFSQVVSEAGKGVADSELNLHRDLADETNRIFRSRQLSSGWFREHDHVDSYQEYSVITPPGGLTDDSALTVTPPPAALIDMGYLVNSFVLPKMQANVAGFPVVVEYTNTQTPNSNLVALEAPTVFAGPGTVKRTDFVFLEVWQSLVAASPKAFGQVTVAVAASITVGDIVKVAGANLFAVAVPRTPGANDFQFTPGNEIATAVDMAAAFNDPLNFFSTIVTAVAVGNVVILYSAAPGAGPPLGNTTTLAVIVGTGGCIAVSGAFFSGGADRPNKPDQTHLFRHGNVQSPSPVWLDDDIVDPTLNFETAQRVQIQYRIRATGAAEAVNYQSNPDGFSTTGTIFAQGGTAAPVPGYSFYPADNATSAGATAYGAVDSGLWIAGDGSQAAAQALGALDGFVYAIPICFVFRHNDAYTGAPQGFDPVNNANGAPLHVHAFYASPIGVGVVIPVNTSDRPDGEFADVVTGNNLLDLRRHVLFGGPDLSGELQFQLQSLLDGNTRTWAIDTADKQLLGGTSGDVSTRHLVCNEVGRPGAPTQRGAYVRSFDHIARRFADQSIVERVVFAFYPGDRTAGAVPPGTTNLGKYVIKAGAPNPGWPTTWYEGDVLHLDLTQLDASTLGGIFQGLPGGGSSGGLAAATYMPAGTVITDVLSIMHDDGFNALAVPQDVQAAVIQGLGTQHLQVSLDANNLPGSAGLPGPPTHRFVGSGGTANGSPRRIFLEVEITYPIGSGLTDTPDHQVVPDAAVYPGGPATYPGPGPVIEVSAAQRPSDYEQLLPPGFRDGYREVGLSYIANDTTVHGGFPGNVGSPVGSINIETLVSLDRFTLRFPRRVEGRPLSTTVFDVPAAALVPVDEPNCEFGSSSRKVVLTPGTPLSGLGQTQCQIVYYAQDPVPNYGALGYQVGVYFRSNAPQTAGSKQGVLDTTGNGTMPQTLVLDPLYMGTDVWTGQVGMGSQDLAYPYVAPLDQIPINDGPIPTTEEWYFTATASMTIDDFNADTGLLTLHTFVQADAQNLLQLGGAAPGAVPRLDAEFRAYYPFSDTSTYRPAVFSQPLYGAVRHKVFVPMLARATADAPNGVGGLLYRKNEVLLTVLTRFAELDEENNVRFVDDPPGTNRTCAAVYRTRNLLLLAGVV